MPPRGRERTGRTENANPPNNDGRGLNPRGRRPRATALRARRARDDVRRGSRPRPPLRRRASRDARLLQARDRVRRGARALARGGEASPDDDAAAALGGDARDGVQGQRLRGQRVDPGPHRARRRRERGVRHAVVPGGGHADAAPRALEGVLGERAPGALGRASALALVPLPAIAK
eukprot:31378-Pelagococcus_subviridis.AAC.16